MDEEKIEDLKENFDSLIENISNQLRMYDKMCDEKNDDFHQGIMSGMYFVADSIQNMLEIQNDTYDENKYMDFINLVEEIEKKYITNY